MSWEAFILKSSPRHEEWLKVFGGDRIPIQGPLLRLANVCGRPDVEIYQLDLKRLTGEQRERLVEHISGKFGIPREVVEQEIERAGVPILAADVGVPIDLRYLI